MDAYRIDIDEIRETEYPMLQGKPSVLLAYQDIDLLPRYNLFGPCRYHDVPKISH